MNDPFEPAGAPEIGPAEAIVWPISSTMFTGEMPTVTGFVAVSPIWVKVAEPKLASVGCGPPTAVGNSSIHSAESPGPV